MKSIFTAPLALACGIALAQPSTIYRCGDSYSSQPCAGGREISAETPSPTSTERRDAAVAAQRDARIADSLEKERLKQEARSASSHIPAPAPQAQPTPHKWPEKNATRKLDVFTASGPPTGKPDKKKEKSAKGGGKKKGKSSDEARPARDAKPTPAGRLAASVKRER